MHGKYYEAGCIPCVLYTASGTSLDWALGVAGIPYVYRCQYVNVYRYEKERTYIVFYLFIIQTHSAEAGWRHCHYYHM